MRQALASKLNRAKPTAFHAPCWRASGASAVSFAADQGFAASTLRWWDSKLTQAAKPRVAMARVVRGGAGGPAEAGAGAATDERRRAAQRADAEPRGRRRSDRGAPWLRRRAAPSDQSASRLDRRRGRRSCRAYATSSPSATCPIASARPTLPAMARRSPLVTRSRRRRSRCRCPRSLPRHRSLLRRGTQSIQTSTTRIASASRCRALRRNDAPAHGLGRSCRASAPPSRSPWRLRWSDCRLTADEAWRWTRRPLRRGRPLLRRVRESSCLVRPRRRW